MKKSLWLLTGMLALVPVAQAQQRPYIGYVYPAGGQQGTTFPIRLGGQNLDGVDAVICSGTGVTAKIVDYFRRLSNEEQALINEQLQELKRATNSAAGMMQPMMAMEMTIAAMATNEPVITAATAKQELRARIEKRIENNVTAPACASISSLVFVEVTIAPDALPGEREIRLVTTRGVSNPLVFHVGQVPEYSRKPMRTATVQVLGKEAGALRKRPAEEVEDRIVLPCTVNGQIASGEINRYRFTAHKGQRLVLTTYARQLIPYIADAVPGWFQPVLTLYDAHGKEVAYNDDYQFRPDPTILYEVPADGEYVFAVSDAIYRGREDFVYRVTVGELPFVTSIYPLGAHTGAIGPVQMKGWNLQDATLTLPTADAGPGVYQLVTKRNGFISNPVPFALDTLPEIFATENNHTPAHAQKVTLPVIINGRIAQPGNWDVYQFAGKSNATIVAEVTARRLDSPLDSILKLTDAKGKLIALNDDCDDLADGLNTHHADSYFTAQLPADGTYFVSIGDTARKGGDEYAYRLRLSAPQPDFALRVVPSSVSLRGKIGSTLTVYALRKDGFSAPIQLTFQNPPASLTSMPVTVTGSQAVSRTAFSFRVDAITNNELVNLTIAGQAKIATQTLAHVAVPAEDRMQAFLWRHLVPAQELPVLAFDPAFDPPPKHIAPTRPPVPATTNCVVTGTTTNTVVPVKGKFTKQQVERRLRELKQLYEDGLLTDVFYNAKVAECEVAL